MRELKFRAWDKIHKQMRPIIRLDLPFGEITDLSQISMDDNYLKWEYARDLIIMQYTGLKDKNGKERYGGDIIKFQYDTGYSKETTKGIIKAGKYQAGHNDWGDIMALGFYVQQIDVCIRQEWNMCCSEIEKGEIIGNIYKNPELIKGGQSNENNS